MKISSAEVPSVEESISTKENGSSYENSDTSVVCNLKVSNVFGNAICNTTNAIDKILADLETNSPLTNGVSGENSSISNGNKSDDSFSCSPANTQRTDDNFSDVSEESIKLHLTDDEEDQDKFDEEIIIDNTSTKKRSLDEKEDAVELKKQKINDGEDEQTEPKKYNIPLDHFRTFMDSKMHSLTRKELEEYCIQKVCEVVGQTSEIGELRHQIKQQEQMLELWRSKMISLNKQTKDLEVVNCKLIQDVRAREREGANVADAVPVKITRSVGLQVSLTLNSLVPRARASTSSVTPPAPSESPQLKRKTRTLLPNSPASTVPLGPVTPPTRSPATPSRPAGTIKTILPRKTPEPKDAQQASLLSKVLQKPPLVPNTPVPIAIRKPSTAEPPKAGVIDLTDEDDIARTVSTPTQVTTGIRVVTPQQISSTAQVVTAGASLVTTTGPRLSYIVTPSGQQPQQVLLATSTAPTRPGQLQRTYMLKPLQNAVATQRVGSIRLPGSPVTVVTQPTRPGQQIRLGGVSTMTTRPIVQRTTTVQIRHPAPLPGPPPLQPSQPSWKAMPPRPSLKISRVGDGIVLSWKILTKELSHYEEIASYQLYAYQETNAAPATDMWRKVGDVKALALPMACTLTQFTDGNKYHFAVRAVDVKSRVGPFSQPEQIVLS